MTPELLETINRHGQRVGQFINNALTDNLNDNNRMVTDTEIAVALFYMSDEALTSQLERYGNILDARKGTPIGFGATK